MTKNEQIKDKLSTLRQMIYDFEDLPKEDMHQVGEQMSQICFDIEALIQPKTTSTSVEQYQCQSYYDDEGTLQDCTCGKCGKQTTSTDIEELRKEYDKTFKYDLLVEHFISVWNFFAPHLSNRSELKKEAVREFVGKPVFGEWSIRIEVTNGEQIFVNRGVVRTDEALKELFYLELKHMGYETNEAIHKYLSSDEKEENES